MADGRIYRWFAANIPMDVVPGLGFRGDIDLILCLREGRGPGATLAYKTWEVKVALADKEGRPRSLKAGKTRDTLRQLNLYRKFGCPIVSLLDVFLCEHGFGARNTFPPEEVATVIRHKQAALSSEKFGYEYLAFEHTVEGGEEVGLSLYRPAFMWADPLTPSAVRMLPPLHTNPGPAFLDLVEVLNGFHASEMIALNKRASVMIILYCPHCRRLILRTMKERSECYSCGADLTGAT